MPKIVKKAAEKKDYLTAAQYAVKNRLDKDLTKETFETLYKKHKMVREKSGRLAEVVFLNKDSHNKTSRFKCIPFHDDIIMAEYAIQEQFKLKKAKGL